MRRLLVVIVGVVAAALAGCGSDSDSARMLERMLPRFVGPAQRYEVRVAGASSNRLRSAHVRSSRLETADGLTLDVAVFDLSELHFDRERREVRGVGKADFAATILQEDLNLHLRDRSALLRNLRVRFTPLGAQVHGSADIPGVRLPFTPELTMDGRLVIDDMGRLAFEPDRLRVVGIEVPAVAAKVLASQINPLVDLNTLRLPVYLRGVEMGGGEARVTGRAILRAGQTIAP